ncbi:glycosyltransferase family 2 protein [Merismopedia glauca]|uniref:Glycosyl transferase n=1 Tax=Merismopedia glauca CCAP 1448/3 TaxID=1296344 RepID=A0A2T1C055_9CYAN|nr:glycosyltransferase [Merismopedia glauca]PSB01503.1 glycosyl transferase [Merismopedia glauca CCAP 1448/3]
MNYPEKIPVSIVIPVHNGGEYFQKCLSCIKNFAPPQTEVIVVADGDEISANLAEYFASQVLRISVAGGPAKARNLGAKAARGEIILFIDADTTINAETIPKIIDVFHQKPEIAALIGSYDDSPGAINFLSQYKNLFHHYTHQNGSEEGSTFWGACGAIRRDIFLEMEGFDESYRRPCVEDIELGYRLKKAGYQIKLCKDIQVKHLKKWEPISLLKAEFFYRAIPWTALIMRDRQLSNDLNLHWSSRISVLLIYGLLASLVATWWWSPILLIVILLALGLLVLNASVYKFFYAKRGLVFTLKMIPWHWFYYIYSGLAFAIGTVRHLLRSTVIQQKGKEALG